MPTKMLSQLQDSNVSPAVIKILHETQVPRHKTMRGHQNIRGYPVTSEDPGALRILSPGDFGYKLALKSGAPKSRDPLREALARTEATSPMMSYETMLTPRVFQTIGEPAIPLGSRISNEPIVRRSDYVTFPAYHKTPNPQAHIAKKCVKKIKTCLTSASDKLLAGLQAIGDFYVSSEQKWESEYPTLRQRATPDASARQATKTLRPTSWVKKLHDYWKPEPAQRRPRTRTRAMPSLGGDGEAAIPHESGALRRRNAQRRERIRGAQLLPRFSPPEGRMCPLERQPRGTHHHCRPCLPETAEPESEEEQCLGTPWSGLQTVAEEGFFGELASEEEGKSMRDDKGFGGCDGEGEGEGEVDDGNDGLECDGLEAGGELCLRHESCVREAMAIRAS